MNGAALTIVIPTYNHLALLRRCLESLRRQTRAADRIVVVDDGSTEDIAGAMASEFPEVAVVRLDRNGGFCRAANAGLRAAETPYVFLLNNDMTLDADCI
ncbi:MAG: glycosyltransferase, partial [Candidatus Hydrogenedentes bacterium]|nr:glycosyltransferase [Candidatus Hydrogenedentota bacterium]